MIFVSGATGNVGRSLCHALVAAGAPFRAFVRDLEKFAAEVPGVEAVLGDLTDGAAVRAAMEGCDHAFLLTNNSPAQAQIEEQFAHAAKDAGIDHVVKISSLEAAPDATAVLPKQHYQSEERIKSLGLGYTFLRPNYYLQNMLMSAKGIAEGGSFSLPLGATQTAPVDTRDVGLAAAKALTEPGHEGKIYALTGPELLTFAQMAEIMSEVLGKPVSYRAQDPAEFSAIMHKIVPSAWQADAVCELFGEIAKGSLAHQSDDLAQLLGRPATSVAQFTTDFAGAFGG